MIPLFDRRKVISIVILVFADSHRGTGAMLELISDIRPDAVFHLGDVDADAGKLASAFSHIPVYAVSGNNDLFPRYPLLRVECLEGKNFFLTHGHLFHVRRGPDTLAAEAARRGARVALFGHTHEAYAARKGPLLLLNPGSISRPRRGRPSFLRLEVTRGDVSYKLIEV